VRTLPRTARPEASIATKREFGHPVYVDEGRSAESAQGKLGHRADLALALRGRSTLDQLRLACIRLGWNSP
jgi:hypothetical protein